MEMRHCCAFSRVLQTKHVFCFQHTKDSLRLLSLLQTITMTSTSWTGNCWLKVYRKRGREGGCFISAKTVTSVWRQSLLHQLTFWVAGWSQSMFLVWSEGSAHPSAASSCRLRTLTAIIHVWSVEIRNYHHVLSPSYFCSCLLQCSHINMHML